MLALVESEAVTALVPGFRPETALERRLLADAELREGLAWGCPRPGHPEGPVGRHVATMVTRIARGCPLRGDLRVLALVHDGFKYRVRPDGGRTPDNDHAWLARRFAERHLSDERLLVALEHHDTPFRIWRDGGGFEAVDRVLAGVPDLDLFVEFVELDASTPGKDQTFLRWFLAVAARHLPAALAA